MRKNITDSLSWRSARGHVALGAYSSDLSIRATLAERLNLDAVDAAFEDRIIFDTDAGQSPQNSISCKNRKARDLAQSLECQLVNLEAQCQQLRKLLDGAKS